MTVKRRSGVFVALVALAFVLATASVGAAAMGKVDKFTFHGIREDVLGPGESVQKDGKPDAVFSASISGTAGAVTGFQLASADGKSVWDTTSGNNVPGIQVKNSDGSVLTESSGSMSMTPFLLAMGVTLTVSDDGSIAKGGKFTLTARFIDNSTSSATIDVAATATTAPTTDGGQSKVQFLSADWVKQNRDLTGKNERLRGNGTADTSARIVLQGTGTIRAISVKSVKGEAAEWDTIPNNGKWLVAATHSGKVLNNADGSLGIEIQGKVTLDLFMSDNGAIKNGKSQFEVTVTFDDNTTAKRVIGAAQGVATDMAIASAQWVQQNRDLTGGNERLRGDGNADSSARIVVQGSNTISAIALKSVKGEAAEWDTIPSNGLWLLGVTQAGKVLNSQDGSVEIPVKDKITLDLWMTDNGAIRNGKSQFEVTVSFTDGSSVTKAVSSAGDESEDSGTAVLIGEYNKDIVGASESRSGNGKKDWAIDLDLTSAGTITEMQLVNVAGPAGEWDTVPGNGRWLMGITDVNGKVLNSSNGSISIPIGKRTQYRLFVENNGSLGDSLTKSRLTISFDDGRKQVMDVSSDAARGTTPDRGTQGSSDKEVALSGPRKASSSDYVGPNERVAKNGKTDWLFNVSFKGKGKVETITLESIDENGVWDTIPNNGYWLTGVVAPGRGLLNNKRTGAVLFEVPRYSNLQLFVEDDGTIAQGSRYFRVTVEWDDGTVSTATN